MSFDVCLAQLKEAGVIDAERAGRFRREYDRLTAVHAKTMGQLDAELQAGRDALDGLEYQAQLEAVQKLKQVGVQRGLLIEFIQHVEKGGKAGNFLAGVIDHHEGARVSSVAQRAGAVRSAAFTRMSGFVGRYKRNLAGMVTERAELDDIVRAMHGEKVDNANARLMADAVTDAYEWLRLQFNRAGGAIPQLKNWGMPHSHDARLIANAGHDAWRDFIRPLLDPARMIDNTTGLPFAGDEALDEALEAVWRNITSEGMDGAIPGAFNGQGKLANRRADHRFLIFRDADAWMAYNAQYGTGDLLGAMLGHVDSMARDIGAMQLLGPNPAMTVRWLSDVANQDALPTVAGGKAVKLAADAKSGAKLMTRMWGHFSGEATVPQSREWARFYSGLRNWNNMSKLGSAALAAFPGDFVTGTMMSRFNGLPLMARTRNYIGLFTPGNKAHRAAAEDAGLVVSEMLGRTEHLWRQEHAGRINLHEFTSRGADTVLRASLLTRHTIAAKQAVGLSFMRDWGRIADSGWDALSAGQRGAFERYGITSADWNRLRAVPVAESGGINLLRPGDLLRADDGEAATRSALKFFDLMEGEMQFAVPGGDSLRATTAAHTSGGALNIQRGHALGELYHSFAQWKTTPIAILLNLYGRTRYGRGAVSPLTYLTGTLAMLMVGGMITVQLRQIMQGKDPQPWDEKLAMKGFVVGGGGGPIGDIIAQGIENDRGNTLTGYLTGPTLANIADPAQSLILSNIGQAGEGKETNWQREASRLVKRNLPAGNLWYLRLVMERGLTDELDELTDPDIAQARRKMTRAAEDQGTEFWWAPGEDAPERAPNLDNMMQEEGAL